MQPYTYYDTNGDADVIVNVVPTAGSGKVWARGRYSQTVRPSSLSLRIGRGIEVWKIIDDLRLVDGDIDQVVSLYEPYVTRADVEGAVRYYKSDPDEIDKQLAAGLAEV
jgi:uncharacterized protein (DUF433 family)